MGLIIRNLCFHSSNKPKLLSHSKFISFLLKNLKSPSTSIRLVTCNAIYAMVYNSQKAKVSIKSITNDLHLTLNEMNNSEEEESNELLKCINYIKQTLFII